MRKTDRLHRRTWAVMVVVHNWRIRQRLPRITRLAQELGFIPKEWGCISRSKPVE